MPSLKIVKALVARGVSGRAGRIPHRLRFRAFNSFIIWCPEGDLNPHNPFGSADFKSAAYSSKILYISEITLITLDTV